MPTRKTSPSTNSPNGGENYGAEQIKVLRGLDPVRERPGMYIGSTDSHGLHHLINEVVDNAVDEFLAGRASEASVEVDGTVVTVTDNGCGIPVEIHPEEGISTVEVVLTMLHAGGKFGGGGYKVSGGLHGVGVSVVNALSEWMEVSVRRDGYEWSARFERGLTVKSLRQGRKMTKGETTGTTVRFQYDPQIFEKGSAYTHTILEQRLREKACIARGMTFILRMTGHKEQKFFSKDGLAELVYDLNAERKAAHPHVIYLTSDELPQFVSEDEEAKDIPVEAALQWTGSSKEHVYSFANIVRTPGEGKHVEGLKAALTKAINNYGRERNKIKKDSDAFRGDDVMNGLTVAIAVKLSNPKFEGQTKDKLHNSEARTATYTFAYNAFSAWLADKRNAKQADAILGRIVASRDIRIAYGQMSKKVRNEATSIYAKSGLPGKLDDCQPDAVPVDERELFIVEGDSAAGSAVDARDSTFQAILPVRGKMTNVLVAKDSQIWKKNTAGIPLEIELILMAMGGRKDVVGGKVIANLNPDDRRYGKIVIAADADADGAHIRNLLLTMFHEMYPQLIGEGRVFIALPPLFKIKLDTNGTKYEYAWTVDEMSNLLRRLGRTGQDVTRFKGLGEMDAEDLARTAFDVDTRKLQQVMIDDTTEAAETLNLVMGKSAERRRAWLEEVGLRIEPEELTKSALVEMESDVG